MIYTRRDSNSNNRFNIKVPPDINVPSVGTTYCSLTSE